MKPMLLINFKTYEEGTGMKALKLAKIAASVAAKEKENVVLSVQAADISRVAASVRIPVYAQAIDPVEPGSHTGWTLPQAVRQAGAEGTLINHSERRMEPGGIKKCVEKCREIGLVSVCCAPTPAEAASIAGYGPDYIAIEPPELIGGKVSVSKARPQVITDTVDAVSRVNGKVKVLCGAGIHNKEDVSKALELGSSGVLVASGIVKSDNPSKVMKDLIKGFYE